MIIPIGGARIMWRHMTPRQRTITKWVAIGFAALFALELYMGWF
jgi:hypothetical protein